MKEKQKDLLINFCIGAGISVAVFFLGFSRNYSILRCLCDAFFVSGVMLTGVGGLRFFRNKGAFDIAGYGVSSVFHLVFPAAGHEREDFYDYRQRKAEKRKGAGPLLFTGAAFLVLSFLAYGLYLLFRE